jgi:Na+/H+-dicarboxylate symporter
MARTMINVIGNGLASVVIAKWEGVFGLEPEVLPDEMLGGAPPA